MLKKIKKKTILASLIMIAAQRTQSRNMQSCKFNPTLNLNKICTHSFWSLTNLHKSWPSISLHHFTKKNCEALRHSSQPKHPTIIILFAKFPHPDSILQEQPTFFHNLALKIPATKCSSFLSKLPRRNKPRGSLSWNFAWPVREKKAACVCEYFCSLDRLLR